jgi:phosphoribosylformylglycinamidine cyclo-ligase
MLDYANAGVSTELGDDASRILYLAAKETWKNRKGMLGEIIVPFDDFTGLRYVKVSSLPKGTVMGGGADGIGTKIEVHERMQDHKTAAYNLICMIADDAVVRGAEPVLALTVFDVNSLGTPLNPRSKEMSEIASGYVEACRLAGIAIINGEVAEIGNRVGGFGSFKYNWGGSCIWFAKEERLLTGREVKPGQSIVGLREPGLRSNGFSLLRKILKRSIGNYWHHKNLGSSSNLLKGSG